PRHLFLTSPNHPIASVPDAEGVADAGLAVLAGGGAWVEVLLVDVSAHRLTDRVEEAVQLAGFALSDKAHPAIGQILHVARDTVAPRNVRGGVSKADALDAAGEVNGVTGHENVSGFEFLVPGFAQPTCSGQR